MSGASGLQASHHYQGEGMNGSCELGSSHKEQEVEMNRLKDDMLPSEHGEWLRACELAALPEQAGRSAWLGAGRWRCSGSASGSMRWTRWIP